jgi:hypothetical protein
MLFCPERAMLPRTRWVFETSSAGPRFEPLCAHNYYPMITRVYGGQSFS